MHCWRLRDNKSESKQQQRDPVIRGPLHFCQFYLQELDQILTVNSLVLLQWEGKRNQLEIQENILLFLTRSALRRSYVTRV